MEETTTPRRGWYWLELMLLIAVAACLLSGMASLHAQGTLADQVVRLHVLANSDSEADQALKLRVRDVVLMQTGELLRNAGNRAEAETALKQELPRLRQLAEEEIRAAGCSYPVEVRLEVCAFPTRVYDGFALPAGEYLALRVLIGRAAGRNWWCVVFPPLCAAAAEEVSATAVAAGLGEEEIALLTGKDRGYVLKFKTVELWQQLKARLERR